MVDDELDDTVDNTDDNDEDIDDDTDDDNNTDDGGIRSRLSKLSLVVPLFPSGSY